MALDAATLALLAAELQIKLQDTRIERVTQPTRDEVIVHLRSREGAHKLLISARSGSARVCQTTEVYENPDMPPSFCMLLRKHLNGGRLLAVRTLPGERIAFFDFMCTNDLGDRVKNTLAAELLGRYCNIVLVNQDEKIVDALKRVDFDASAVRQLLPGLPYTLPPKPEGRMDFLTSTPAQIIAKLSAERPLAQAMQKTLGGVGPVVLREVAFRTLGASDVPVADMGEEETAVLAQNILGVQREYEAGGRPCLVWRDAETPMEFSFTPLTQYLPQCKVQEFDGFSVLLEAYYAQKDRVVRRQQKSKALRKTLQNIYDRAVRRQAARTEDLRQSHHSDELRVFGELLTANLHSISKGMQEVTLPNWYTGEDANIKLDMRLSPSANAQKYFKEYKKKQTAAVMLKKLLAEGEREIVYLETVLYEVDMAAKDNELEEIRAELKAGGYLKHYKPKNKKSKPADFWRYHSSDGFLILAGRNNAQNEKLTLKIARGKDLWFHVRGTPGSHVVVMSEGQDIPLATQNEAAMLAVHHSGLSNSSKVPVDFTLVKNIRKTGDLPMGMVLYEHYETATVTPNEEVLQALQKGDSGK